MYVSVNVLAIFQYWHPAALQNGQRYLLAEYLLHTLLGLMWRILDCMERCSL